MKKILLNSLLFSTGLFFFNACSVNKAKIDNSLEAFFKKENVEGCFTFLDNATGEIKLYNMAMDTSRFAPFETFDIVSSLFLLQTGVVTDEKMTIALDSASLKYFKGKIEPNIVNAFQFNATPFFQKTISGMGKDTLQDWISRLGYGNKDISGPLDSFWLNNRLKISPDEQLGLLKRLYFDQLPFRKTVHASVRQMMIKENNSAYKFAIKNGLGLEDSTNRISWVNGWVEENNHVYFFSSVIKDKENKVDLPAIHLNIVKGILTQYGFFKGKK
jgi:beta-lactamase class D